MPVKKPSPSIDTTTEEKIKAAAHVVFRRKGFAATRTRDIADEAKINLALLNYYYRSKQKLFELIMFETVTGFLQNMETVFNDASTSLERKIQLVAERYIDLFIADPEIPLFIMSELRNPDLEILQKLPALNVILKSTFIGQYKDAVTRGRITEPNPLHFIMNLMGLTIFPFIGSPMLKKLGRLNNKEFDNLMQERKKMIPVWIKAMLKAKQ
jgi:AcrR family transcriptional regulator